MKKQIDEMLEHPRLKQLKKMYRKNQYIKDEEMQKLIKFSDLNKEHDTSGMQIEAH